MPSGRVSVTGKCRVASVGRSRQAGSIADAVGYRTLVTAII